MKIYVTGEREPFRAEVVLGDDETVEKAKVIVGGEVIPEIMGHFAVQLSDGEIEAVEQSPLVIIIDQRVV
jgi:hypothetical protein